MIEEGSMLGRGRFDANVEIGSRLGGCSNCSEFATFQRG